MRKISKNNKGYTLVELLVAMVIFVIMLMEVYSVMANSSTIYRKGGYEVQLQSEAQQVIQQLEDIMVDCNGSISYDNAAQVLTVSSNVIDPFGGAPTPIIYTVSYVPAGSSAPFGTLTYQKTGMTAPIPLADYVEYFDVDMSGYGNDNVTLNIKLANEDYAYTATKDVYLRNEIGSGGSGPADDTSSAKQQLDVKRFQTYDLASMYDKVEDGYKYDYKEFYFKDAVGNKVYTSTGGEYSINSVSYKLAIQSSYNVQGKTDEEYGPYLIYATGTKTKLSDGSVTDIDDTNPLLISAHTDPVSWGFADYSFYYLPGAEPSYKATGLTEFKGISLEAADSVRYSYVVECKAGYHFDGDTDGTTKHTLWSSGEKKVSDTQGGMPSSQGENSTVYFYTQSQNISNGWKIVKESDGSTKEFQCQLPTLHGYVDKTSNAVVAYNNGSVWNSDRCYEYLKNDGNGMLKNGHKFYIYVEVKWKSPDVTEHFKTYLYPTNRALTDDEKKLLEDQAK